jgi:DNA-binding IclR family transcriptional regulator
MPYTFKELEEKTVHELREIAATLEHEAVQGYTQMNKERLLPALCRALGIEMRDRHQVVGIDKTAIKAQIRRLKAQRDAALAAKDRKAFLEARMGIRRLKRKLRRSMV